MDHKVNLENIFLKIIQFVLMLWSYQLVSQHFLRVEVGDEKADVVALNLLPPQDDEVLRAAHHEPHELVAEQLLHVVRLLDCYRDPHRVNARLDKNLESIKYEVMEC